MWALQVTLPPILWAFGLPVSGWLWHRVAGTISGRRLEDAHVGEVPVEVSPGKLFLHTASWFKRLHGFRDVQIGHVLVWQLQVLGRVDVLLGHHHPCLKKEFINANPVLLGRQHHDDCCDRGRSWKRSYLDFYEHLPTWFSDWSLTCQTKFLISLSVPDLLLPHCCFRKWPEETVIQLLWPETWESSWTPCSL